MDANHDIAITLTCAEWIIIRAVLNTDAIECRKNGHTDMAEEDGDIRYKIVMQMSEALQPGKHNK